MRLTTKGRFAVTAMIDSGVAPGQGTGDARRHQPTAGNFPSYLEQLFGKLRRHEIVEPCAVPAADNLARKAEDVTVADIIIAVDEPLDATQCGGKVNCHGADQEQGTRCMTHDLWSTLNAKMVDYLDSVSLKDLVDRAKGKTANNVIVLHRPHLAADWSKEFECTA